MVLRFKNFNNLKYVGGLSQIKNIKDPIKLSANESALGPSKKAINAFIKSSKQLYRYPDGNSDIVTNLLRNKINELVEIKKRNKKSKSSSRKF